MTCDIINQQRQSLFEGLISGDSYGGPTAMAGILNDSLQANQTFDINDLTERYLNWWRTDAFDTGPVFDAVFQKIDKGMEPVTAVQSVGSELNGNTAGCNPAHRIAPMALFNFIPTDLIAEYARQEACISHSHPIAGDMSAIMALLCRFLLEGWSWEEAKIQVRASEPEAWALIKTASISNDGFGPNVLRTAIDFLDRPNSLLQASKFAGLGNYFPVIVGTIEALRKL